MHISIVGVGMGSAKLLTPKAHNAIKGADLVLGPQRLGPCFSSLNPHFEAIPFSKWEQRLGQCDKDCRVALLASGDVGFFSISSAFDGLPQDAKVEYINGLSSLQYFAALLKIPYEDIKTISVHGRDIDVVPYVCYHKWVFVLTGGNQKAHDVIGALCEAGLGHVRVYVGEALSYEQERVVSGSAQQLLDERFDDLSVVLICNDNHADRHAPVRDVDMIRGDVPMTKQAIRALSLEQLAIIPRHVVYDIGAGTGAVSVAAARKAYEGTVYAIERSSEAIALLHQNREKHGAYNIRIVEGLAPEALAQLPKPDVVFIGGSSGQLAGIIDAVLQKNVHARFVINAIALETLSEAVFVLKRKNMKLDIICANIASAHGVGQYSMMKAQNPVYVISGEYHE